MRNLFTAGRVLLLDFAATVFFVVLFELTGSLIVSVAVGFTLAAAQIGWRLARHRSVDALQWVSLGLIAVAGTASLATNSPVFVMLKPSALYVIAGAAMFQRGWMNRYVPPIALEVVPDMVVAFGYVWAGLMFLSAAVNVAVALRFDAVTWGAVMTAWGLASKFVLFLIQYTVMRTVGRRRRVAVHA
jgi:intracellular septation protein